MNKKSAGTPVTTALDKAGIAYASHLYDHDPRTEAFGREAVEALGIDPDLVYKTLVVDTGAGLAVGVVPVLQRLDLKALATALGVKKLAMAAPEAAERSSGMVVGGISPIGQRRALPTVLDDSMVGCPTVYVSGGRRGFDVELDPQDLKRLVRATFASISAHS